MSEGTRKPAAVSKPLEGDARMAMGAAQVALAVGEAPSTSIQAEHGLVDLCRRGDARAFAELVSAHEGLVYSLAVRLLGDAEEARDVAQEVFLQVYRMISRFQGRSSLRTWIYRIVVNQCRNRRRFWFRRRRDRSIALEDLAPADEARVTSAQPTPDPYQEICRRETAVRVQEALSGISFEHRAVLLLREVEGLTCEEIATSLGLPTGTVKSRLARAREALRERLLPLLKEEEARP
jgi:RNA polymerase sigma-70 factor (ECF subfamily)